MNAMPEKATSVGPEHRLAWARPAFPPACWFAALYILFLLLPLRGWSATDLDPKILGTWPGFDRAPGKRVEVSDHYAFVVGASSSSGLKVYDLADRVNPSPVATLATPLNTADIALAGNYAYIACGDAGLLVVDISQPARPQLVAQVDTPDPATAVSCSGTRVFVLSTAYNSASPGQSACRVTIVDVTTPATPRKLGELTVVGTVTGYSAYTDIAAAGNLVVVSGWWWGDGDGGSDRGRVLAIDASNPSAPQHVGTYDTIGRLETVALAGTQACISPYWWNTAGTLMGSLDIIDLADPSAPRKIGTYTFSGQTTVDMRIVGNFAYLSKTRQAGGGAIEIIDLSQPGAPARKVTFTSSSEYIASLAVSGTNLCALSDVNVLVFETPDPTVIRRVGAYGVGQAEHVAVDGNYAYVADGSAGLKIIDVSNPNNPVLVASADTPGYASRLVIRSNVVYLVDSQGGFHAYDVTNAAAPRRMGTWNPTSGLGDVVLSGNYAYVADNDSFHILDISKPVPKLIASLRSQFEGMPYTIAFTGNYVFLAENDALHPTLWTGLVEIFDVSNPVFPTLASTYSPLGWVLGITISGNYAFLCGRYKVDDTSAFFPYMEVLDVSDPSNPQLVSTYFPEKSRSRASRISVLGTRAFLTVGPADSLFAGRSEVEILDISVPAQPRRIGAIPVDQYGYGGTAASGDRVFVAQGTSGLGMYDLSFAAGLKRLATAEVSGPASGLARGANEMAVAAGDAGVQVFSLSNPSAPAPLRSHDVGGIAWAVATRDQRAWVAVGTNGLLVLDLTRDQQAQIGSLQNLGDVRNILVSGTTAYLASLASGLQVVDASDPANLRRIGGLETTGQTIDLAMFGSFLLAAQREAGLDILDVSHPANPVRVANFNASGLIASMAVSGSNVIVSDGIEGFKVIDLSDPARPRVLGKAPAKTPARSITVQGRFAYVGEDGWGVRVYDIANPASPRRVAGNGALDAYDLVVAGNYLYAAGGNGGVGVYELFSPPLELKTLPWTGNRTLQLRVDGPAGATARLQRSADLKTWQDWQSVNLSGQPVTVTDTMSGEGQNFYRLGP